MPTPLFFPSPAQQTLLLEALNSGDHSLNSLALTFQTSAEALALFIATGPFAARLAPVASINALCIRHAAAMNLTDTLRLLRTLVLALESHIKNTPVDFQDPASLQQSRQSLNSARLAASAILRLSRFNPNYTPKQPTANSDANTNTNANTEPRANPTASTNAPSPTARNQAAPRLPALPTFAPRERPWPPAPSAPSTTAAAPLPPPSTTEATTPLPPNSPPTDLDEALAADLPADLQDDLPHDHDDNLEGQTDEQTAASIAQELTALLAELAAHEAANEALPAATARQRTELPQPVS